MSVLCAGDRASGPIGNRFDREGGVSVVPVASVVPVVSVVLVGSALSGS